MGSGTRAAIVAFQQDRGLAATGVADQTLLQQLKQVPLSSSERKNNSVDPITDSQSSTSTPLPITPQTTQPSQTATIESSMLAGASTSEKDAIQNACGYYKRNSGPAEYYSCLRKEMANLSNSAGRPDLSRASESEQAAIENACGYYKRNSGPAEYYSCLRKKLVSLGYS
ncbi:conserved hypothetical protein [Ricinus communis]|uniref:Peptidoglycan binding-like domain-containing protein n=1 Tax=Ricinus communis TaxID=3988 RepID=B9TBI6_RICCO|nr:conserved hypothetical protein [Ricinus communis]